MRLSKLLTACNFPHRVKSFDACSELLSKEESSSLLFVGKITISVKGITATNSIPPTSHQTEEPISHAAVALKNPAAANAPCMTAALR